MNKTASNTAISHKRQEPRLKSLRSTPLIASIALTITSIILIFLYNVPKTITKEDQRYITTILKNAGYSVTPKPKSFQEEINLIKAIQNSAFDTAPKVSLIPLSSPREPKNLYEVDAAYCGDRARYIDKALRFYGLETRYASLYEDEEGHSFVSTLLTRGSDTRSESHALVEVLTEKGWLIVDTRKHWISLTQANIPISLKDLQNKPLSAFQWSSKHNTEPAWPLLDKNYHIIYELYSRHGQFYAPYTKYVPDIFWPGFIKHNILRHFE